MKEKNGTLLTKQETLVELVLCFRRGKTFLEIVFLSAKKANLLNYRFSKLGDYLGESKSFTDFPDDQDFTNVKTSRFQTITIFK